MKSGESGKEEEREDEEDGHSQTITCENLTIADSHHSSPVHSHGSPRSLLSWHCSDLISIPSSSRAASETLSDQELNDYFDLENGSHPLPSGALSPHQPDAFHHPHPLTTELLTAITQHLVMPRLPVVPTCSHNSSRPASREGRSSTVDSISFHRPRPNRSTSGQPPCHQQHHHHLHHSSLHSLDPASRNHELSHYPPSAILQNASRILVVGDAESVHGLGALSDLLSATASFVGRADRASDILPDFKLLDPRTYNSLIHHIEAPFCRLKAILNAKACYQYQSLPTSVRQDLLSLVNCWIEREGYLLLFVQVDSFPVPPARLEFIRTLSRLIPTIPFIPSSLSLPQAIDGHAILSRQLVAHRVRHLPIPNPNNQTFLLPTREECLKQSSRSLLDWLAVEFASSGSSSMSRTFSSEGDLVGDANQKVSGNEETDEFEPDKLSERVGRQVKRRAKNKLARQAVKRSYHPTVKQQVISIAIDQGCQSWLSTDALGLPSLPGMLRLGLRQVRKNCRLLFKRLVAHLLQSHFTPNLTATTHSDHRWTAPSRNPACQNHSDRSASSQPSLLRTPSEDSGQPSKSACPPLPHHLPPTPSTTTWLVIGFVTATTAAALTVWW
ncbi:hypothetical protein PCANC_06149 [Puccinia coronata f. sp. avenae]|uniref:Uncharacterized protein n=1 Tax=Puccinia coronata f. sp. avenae TaxID=200324 RepID=A0A2N5VTH0_9BASI|nr:hypothetical protein PCASD_03469 [Puccinia coronata f. sp. avenae]PLW53298.1 hypothetical protein PCANC_06149 [Puccinia coronata f. sp. avenae]